MDKFEGLNVTAADYSERGYTQTENVVNQQLQRGPCSLFQDNV